MQTIWGLLHAVTGDSGDGAVSRVQPGKRGRPAGLAIGVRCQQVLMQVTGYESPLRYRGRGDCREGKPKSPGGLRLAAARRVNISDAIRRIAGREAHGALSEVKKGYELGGLSSSY